MMSSGSAKKSNHESIERRSKHLARLPQPRAKGRLSPFSYHATLPTPTNASLATKALKALKLAKYTSWVALAHLSVLSSYPPIRLLQGEGSEPYTIQLKVSITVAMGVPLRRVVEESTDW